MEVTLTLVAAGLSAPTTLTSPPGDPRLFVTEQPGRVRIIKGAELLSAPFLDITHLTTGQGERGLLGLAFHPDFADNGRFFVNYTNLQGDTRVVEYRVSSNPDLADPDPVGVLVSLTQPHPNHNGGDLHFGSDGMLYVATGDGGGANDPQGNGQNVHTLHGGILRLDVPAPGIALIPPDNPFAGRPQDGREELWAWGLRNPWRFSFDHSAGLIYVSDVGQGRWEEVNVAPAHSPALNYGWAVMEGSECLAGGAGGGDCDSTGLRTPTFAYPHPEGCAVIGGSVYRGSGIPELDGHYVYSDLCGRFVRSFRYINGTVTDHRDWAVTVPAQVGSIGTDSAGEIYFLARDGRVYRLDPAADE